MIKKIILILCILLTLPACAETILTGRIDYNVDSARQELLQNCTKKLSPHLISKNMIDKNNHKNLEYLLTGNVELKDRTLAFFSDSTYAVMYENDKYHVWYYTNSGDLIYAEEKNQLDYPYKSYKYDTSGKLINMGLRVSKAETFIYTPKGKLIAHWKGQYAYDENGKVIMTRRYAN